MPMGSRPYSVKVITAPITEPAGLVASATAINRVTYSQAIRTRYIGALG